MKARNDAPVDRGCLVGVIFFILGLGTLLPWNFFMTATMYFQDRLNTSVWVNGTVVQQKEYYFNNWMTLLSQLPLLLFTFLNSFLYQRVSEKMRISGSLVCMLLLFALTAALVKIPMDSTDCFFSITMATIWFINSFGAVLQGSLFGLVGMLPLKYNAVFMSGQGLAGTFAALAMLLSIYSEADKETAALGYFITPCVGTVIALLSYMLLHHLEFAQFYFKKSKIYEAETNHELLIKDSVEMVALGNGKLNGHANGSVPNGNGALAHGDHKGEESDEGFITREPANTSDRKLSVREVFKKIWVMAFCVTFVFIVTLSVFPAIAVEVKTQYEGTKWEVYFIPVCCFLFFNIMDWLGRTVTTLVQWPPKESRLFPALVVSRVIFIPLLMLCNIRNHYYLPTLFSHDAAFSVLMLLFAGSSGYFVCLSMSYAPQLVELKDAETAGALMTFFLALGLSLGAALSFPLRLLV